DRRAGLRRPAPHGHTVVRGSRGSVGDRPDGCDDDRHAPHVGDRGLEAAQDLRPRAALHRRAGAAGALLEVDDNRAPMRPRLRFAALCALFAALSACGRDPGAGVFRVALLTPGSIADGGWNAGAYAGLQAIQREFGAEVRQVETRTPADFEEG